MSTELLSFPQDDNGFITPLELASVMTQLLGHELDTDEVLEMISEADMDDDGKISFNEFRRIMCSV